MHDLEVRVLYSLFPLLSHLSPISPLAPLFRFHLLILICNPPCGMQLENKQNAKLAEKASIKLGLGLGSLGIKKAKGERRARDPPPDATRP